MSLLVFGVAALATAGQAAAAPWGTAGADYNGVLCRLGTTDVPMGAWTVNGTVPAFSTVDVTGTGPLQQPAPVSGTPSTMAPGQAGFSAADIGAVAYLLAANQGGSSVELAELSAVVARVAGSGQTQAQCLGQNGTSAARAAARLAAARRYAGPYTVEVQAPSGVIPGANADALVRVRSASGAATPGIAVTVTAGGTPASLVTGTDGVARTTFVVPATPEVTISATASAPAGLVYLNTSPVSIAAGPTAAVTGTATLRPVLHPKPAVAVSTDGLALAGTTVRPVADVTGTFGYSGSGVVALFGPVRPAAGKPCSSLSEGAFGAGTARWQDTFTFTGDAQYRAQPTPALDAGCYGLRATVTTTNSSPQERAGSQLSALSVSTLALTSVAGSNAAAPGGLTATVVGATPGDAMVTTTVRARGPLPVSNGACTGNFDAAPVAGTSAPTPLGRTGTELRATVTLPDVRTTGCYALDTRSQVSLDGRSIETPLDPVASKIAILRPSIVVATDAVSGRRGTPMPGTVQVSGTFGFPGVVAVGVVEGTTIPIGGCRDATFTPARTPTTTTAVPTKADMSYAFRTPAPARNACYSVAATFTLAANPAVTASSGAPNDATVFLAGVSPDAGAGSVVQQPGAPSITRAVITYSVTALLILAGAAALFARTFMGRGADGPRVRWRPNRDDGSSESAGLLSAALSGDPHRPRPISDTG